MNAKKKVRFGRKLRGFEKKVTFRKKRIDFLENISIFVKSLAKGSHRSFSY